MKLKPRVAVAVPAKHPTFHASIPAPRHPTVFVQSRFPSTAATRRAGLISNTRSKVFLGTGKMNTAPRTESQWKARFNIHPDGVIASRVLSLPDITLVTESDGSNTRIISIEIVTPSLSLLDAMDYSQRIANRCADILSFISGYGVSCSLRQINEIAGEDGTAKEGVIPVSMNACLAKPEEVDLTKPAFLRTIQGKDEKLVRQLSHFRRGISSSDIIEQIREFYQIIEDEYGDNDPRIAKYKYVRHLVSHPELADPKAKAAAIAIVGKEYLDPSEPNDLSVLSTHLVNMKTEARSIITSKI